jgi:chromosomal replication initiation ATPase DnaA
MLYQLTVSKDSIRELAGIVNAVCEEFGITVDELSKNQKVNRYASSKTVFISYARTVAMHLLSKCFRQQDVANIMNCSNHSTVSCANRKLELLLETNPLVVEKLKNITDKLTNHE